DRHSLPCAVLRCFSLRPRAQGTATRDWPHSAAGLRRIQFDRRRLLTPIGAPLLFILDQSCPVLWQNFPPLARDPISVSGHFCGTVSHSGTLSRVRRRSFRQRTTSNAKPFRYSDSGMEGIIG